MIFVNILLVLVLCQTPILIRASHPLQTYRLTKINGRVMLRPFKKREQSTFQSRSLPPSSQNNEIIATKEMDMKQTPRQYSYVDPLTGSFKFGYVNSMDYREEEREINGIVRGRYGWKDATGRWHRTTFVADDKGYRIIPGKKTFGANPLGESSKPTKIRQSTSEKVKSELMKLKGQHIESLKRKTSSSNSVPLGRPALAHPLPLTDMAIKGNTNKFGQRIKRPTNIKLPEFSMPHVNTPPSLKVGDRTSTSPKRPSNKRRRPIVISNTGYKRKPTVSQGTSTESQSSSMKKPSRRPNRPPNFSSSLMAPLMNMLLGNLRKSQKNNNKTKLQKVNGGTPASAETAELDTKNAFTPESISQKPPEIVNPIEVLNKVFTMLQKPSSTLGKRPTIQYLQ